MGLFDFVKDAGEKIFHTKEKKAAREAKERAQEVTGLVAQIREMDRELEQLPLYGGRVLSPGRPRQNPAGEERHPHRALTRAGSGGFRTRTPRPALRAAPRSPQRGTDRRHGL